MTTQPASVIRSVERLPNSASGNPRWLVHFFDASSAKTSRDSAVNFGIEEYIGKPVIVEYDRSEIKTIKLA
jgi:hypothetical protein